MLFSPSSDRCSDNAGDWTTTDIPKNKASLYNSPGDCSCEDGWQTCPEGAEGRPLPHMTTRADNILYNITDSPFSTQEYLLRTFQKFEFDRTR